VGPAEGEGGVGRIGAGSGKRGRGSGIRGRGGQQPTLITAVTARVEGALQLLINRYG